jgi:hypothetical protein
MSVVLIYIFSPIHYSRYLKCSTDRVHAGTSGRAAPCFIFIIIVGLRPLACWDFGFESHRGHGCLSIVSVVCCQVEVSATDWSPVQRSPIDCGASCVWSRILEIEEAKARYRPVKIQPQWVVTPGKQTNKQTDRVHGQMGKKILSHTLRISKCNNLNIKTNTDFISILSSYLFVNSRFLCYENRCW